MHNDGCDDIDFQNYKGLFYNAPTEKYIDNATGAHFRYTDLFDKLSVIAQSRKSTHMLSDTTLALQSPSTTKHTTKLHHSNLLKVKLIKNIGGSRKPLIFSPKFIKPFIRLKSPDFLIPHIKSPMSSCTIKIKDSQIKKSFPLKIQNLNSDTFFKSLDMRQNEPLSMLKNYKDISTVTSKALFKKFNKSISRNKESIDLLLEHFSNPPTSTFRRTLQRKSFVHL